jgi:nitrogen fixation protein NifB
MRVAVASTSGAVIDEHFGHAAQFRIWELTASGFHQVEVRQRRQHCSDGGCDCGARKPVQAAVELVADCQAVLVAQIGEHGVKQLAAHGILAFESNDPISVALQELAAHEAIAGRIGVSASECCVAPNPTDA